MTVAPASSAPLTNGGSHVSAIQGQKPNVPPLLGKHFDEGLVGFLGVLFPLFDGRFIGGASSLLDDVGHNDF